MTTAREKSIKLLVAKFVKLVESLDPGERLSIKKVPAKTGAPARGKRTPAGTKRSHARAGGAARNNATKIQKDAGPN